MAKTYSMLGFLFLFFFFDHGIFLKYFNFIFILSLWFACMYVCICDTCMSGVLEGQKRASDLLDLEL